MKYTELVEEVKKLSNKYSFNKTLDSSVFESKIVIYYGSTPALRVYNYQLYHVEVIAEKFNKLPFSHKLRMLVNEYAITPIDKRFDENKYNVIIGNNPHDDLDLAYTVWSQPRPGCFVQAYADDYDLYYDDDNQFTPYEYQDLISFIKNLPDGKFQAMVAEHGKTLVKEDNK